MARAALRAPLSPSRRAGMAGAEGVAWRSMATWPGERPVLGALLLSIALLSGCFGQGPRVRNPVPDAVPFPDDPRVLHGALTLRLDSLEYPPLHRLSSDGQAMLLGSNDRNPLHLRGADGLYRAHRPAIAFDLIHRAIFDRSSDTLTWYEPAEGYGAVLLRRQAISGGPPQEMEIAMPAGRVFGGLHAVQGRLLVFSHAQTDHDDVRYQVIDPADGSLLGTGTLPSYGSELGNHSGRAIGFHDWRADTLYVLDTRRLERLISLRQRPCGGDTVVDISHSGRWLLYGGCGEDMFLVDLDLPEPQARRLPWADARARPTFAEGNDEIVWYGIEGGIDRYDPATGERMPFELAEDAPTPSPWDWHYPPMWYADLGLLVYRSEQHRLAVMQVEGDRATTLQLLPRVWFEEAELELVASEVEANGIRYRLNGELRSGAQTFELTGTVTSLGLHVYHPSPIADPTASHPAAGPAGLEPATSPHALLEANVHDSAGQHLFRLNGITFDREAGAAWHIVFVDPDDHEGIASLLRP